VATAVSAAVKYESCVVVTEDLDFYEPKAKGLGAATRQAYFRGAMVGSVQSYLKKKVAVVVKAVAMY